MLEYFVIKNLPTLNNINPLASLVIVKRRWSNSDCVSSKMWCRDVILTWSHSSVTTGDRDTSVSLIWSPQPTSHIKHFEIFVLSKYCSLNKCDVIINSFLIHRLSVTCMIVVEDNDFSTLFLRVKDKVKWLWMWNSPNWR